MNGFKAAGAHPEHCANREVDSARQVGMTHSLRQPLSDTHIPRPSNEVRVVGVDKTDFLVGLHSMQSQVHHFTAVSAAQKIFEQKVAPGRDEVGVVKLTTLLDVNVPHNVVIFDQSAAEFAEQRPDVTPRLGTSCTAMTHPGSRRRSLSPDLRRSDFPR